MATKTVPVLDRAVTRQELMRVMNEYHYRYHTPWYVKLWRRWTR